jgi:hypothetical protein
MIIYIFANMKQNENITYHPFQRWDCEQLFCETPFVEVRIRREVD